MVCLGATPEPPGGGGNNQIIFGTHILDGARPSYGIRAFLCMELQWEHRFPLSSPSPISARIHKTASPMLPIIPLLKPAAWVLVLELPAASGRLNPAGQAISFSPEIPRGSFSYFSTPNKQPPPSSFLRTTGPPVTDPEKEKKKPALDFDLGYI